MSKKNKTLYIKRYYFFLLFFSIIVTINCARVIAPKGGPRDKIPPVVVASDPLNYSKNFKKKKFQVTFDEYIQLKNVNQELLVSPPIIEKPEVLLKPKSMRVKFKEHLPDSTTVNFNFYNAIADYNEGNIYLDYQYIFSTGDELDTLFVNGSIVNAFDLTPVKDAFIMLYKNTADSVPKTILPSFLSKSNEEGIFVLRNMPAGNYKVFALSDANYNKIFDLPNEPIAFLDTLISPAVEIVTRTDTIAEDSIVTTTEVISKLDSVELFMFEEENPVQYLEDKIRDEKGRRISFYFTETLLEPLKISLVDSLQTRPWYIMEENPTKDTIAFWISDTTIAKKDTLILKLDYFIYDSVGKPYLAADTIKLMYKEETEDKQQKGGFLKKLRQEEEEEDTIVISELKLRTNIARSTLGLEKDLVITPKFPILHVDPLKIYLFELNDTIENPIEFKFTTDTLKPRSYRISYPFIERELYKLLIDTAAFEDIYGNINDTLLVRYSIQKENYYGNILLKLTGISQTSIIQLLSEAGQVLREYTVNNQTNSLNINLLPPGKFNLKLIVDNNNNGVWDTGEYEAKRQPEKVYLYNKTITIKSGWDNDLIWNIE